MLTPLYNKVTDYNRETRDIKKKHFFKVEVNFVEENPMGTICALIC